MSDETTALKDAERRAAKELNIIRGAMRRLHVEAEKMAAAHASPLKDAMSKLVPTQFEPRTREDIHAFIRSLGWNVDAVGHCYRNPANDYEGPCMLYLHDVLIELFDAFYMAGWKAGLERGAYEEMTQEDAS